MDLNEQIVNLNDEICDILKYKFNIKDSLSSKSRVVPSTDLPVMLQEFYAKKVQLKYAWDSSELAYPNGEKIKGRINILKAEQVLQDWTDELNIDEEEDEDNEYKLADFKVVDLFVDEACAGIHLDKDAGNKMFYYDFGETSTEFMGVDFNGYLELMFAARGFWYWQLAVLYIKNGNTENQVEVENFKTYMPQLFPDFKWEEFVALYEKVKIK